MAFISIDGLAVELQGAQPVVLSARAWLPLCVPWGLMPCRCRVDFRLGRPPGWHCGALNQTPIHRERLKAAVAAHAGACAVSKYVLAQLTESVAQVIGFLASPATRAGHRAV